MVRRAVYQNFKRRFFAGKRRYNIKLWKTFTDCFNCLPVAAIVDEKIFCCHGGLSPDLQSMEQIRRIMRPTDVPDQGLLCDLLWSDPDKVRLPYWFLTLVLICFKLFINTELTRIYCGDNCEDCAKFWIKSIEHLFYWGKLIVLRRFSQWNWSCTFYENNARTLYIILYLPGRLFFVINPFSGHNGLGRKWQRCILHFWGRSSCQVPSQAWLWPHLSSSPGNCSDLFLIIPLSWFSEIT